MFMGDYGQLRPEYQTPDTRPIDKPGFGYNDPFLSILGGAMPTGIPGFPAMPGFPGLPSLNTSTSSSAAGGDQSQSGDFISHGVNFGSAQHGAMPSWLLWGGVAFAAYWFLVRK